MSRSDNYLSLCLEQASLSSLHYRHGCIIVRGGKVIGKGYNDYRPGFDGGNQNNARLPSAGPFAEPDTFKPKLKKPTNPSNPIGTGATSLLNTPLSMHSEMMAISSALSLSAAIACQGTARSAQWLEKPCFKLPSRSKRQSRLLHLKAYTKDICRAAEEQATLSERRGESHVQQSCFEASASRFSPTLSETMLQRGRGRGEERGGSEREGQQIDASEHREQQCPPPFQNQQSQVSGGRIAEGAAVYEQQQRETPHSVSVRPARWESESSSHPSQERSDFDTPTLTTTATTT